MSTSGESDVSIDHSYNEQGLLMTIAYDIGRDETINQNEDYYYNDANQVIRVESFYNSLLIGSADYLYNEFRPM